MQVQVDVVSILTEKVDIFTLDLFSLLLPLLAALLNCKTERLGLPARLLSLPLPFSLSLFTHLPIYISSSLLLPYLYLSLSTHLPIHLCVPSFHQPFSLSHSHTAYLTLCLFLSLPTYVSPSFSPPRLSLSL